MFVVRLFISPLMIFNAFDMKIILFPPFDIPIVVVVNVVAIQVLNEWDSVMTPSTGKKMLTLKKQIICIEFIHDAGQVYTQFIRHYPHFYLFFFLFQISLEFHLL